MITHDWLIFNGYFWRQFEGVDPDSWSGEYSKSLLDEHGHEWCIIIFKFNDEKDNFSRTGVEIRGNTGEIRVNFYDKSLLSEQLNMLIKIMVN